MLSELNRMKVKVFGVEPNGITDELVRDIFGTMARVISYETRNMLSGKFEGDWVRIGYESWHQVARVKTGFVSSELIVMKSIVSLGDMHDKALEEATRLAILGKNYAPIVYAVTPASIVKEFLVEDTSSLPSEEIAKQIIELNDQLGKYGLWIQGDLSALYGHTIQHGGRMKLLDAGTGDISGTARF